MKLKNTPARKLARQIGAEQKLPAKVIYEGSQFQQEIEHARNIRTKKQRTARGF